MAVTEKTLIGTIDCTPSWSALLPVMLLAYTDGTPKGHAAARSELERMARLADLYVEAQALGKVQ